MERVWSHRRRGVTRPAPHGKQRAAAVHVAASLSLPTARARSTTASIRHSFGRRVTKCLGTKNVRSVRKWGRASFLSRSTSGSFSTFSARSERDETLLHENATTCRFLSQICACVFTFFVLCIYVEGHNFALIVDSMERNSDTISQVRLSWSHSVRVGEDLATAVCRSRPSALGSSRRMSIRRAWR